MKKNSYKIYKTLIRAKKLYKEHPEYWGMCHCIGLAFDKRERGSSNYGVGEELTEIIPEFNRNFLNCPKDRYGKAYWWEPDTEPAKLLREEAFDKLIKIYSKKKLTKFVLWIKKQIDIINNKLNKNESKIK